MHSPDPYLQLLSSDSKTPSLQYAFFDEHQILYHFEQGLANIRDKQKIQSNISFNAYSVTKTFTALAIMQLAENRSLSIEDPIRKYLPGLPYPENIKIEQILSHTAGIPNPIPLNWIHLESEHASFDRNSFFEQIIRKHPRTVSNPDEKFSYSNLGYVILGNLIEKLSGLTYEEYIRLNIFNKLNLTRDALGFVIPDISRHAKGYQKKMSFLNLLLGFYINKSKFMGPAEGRWKPFRPFYVNGISYGGLIANLEGLVSYVQAYLKKDLGLLSSPYMGRLFLEKKTLNNRNTGMCLSWFCGELKGNKYYCHAGGGGGYYCEIRLYPGLNRGSVVIFNRTGISDERKLNTIDAYFIEGSSGTAAMHAV